MSNSYFDQFSFCVAFQDCCNMTGFKYMITFVICLINIIAAAMNITNFSNASGTYLQPPNSTNTSNLSILLTSIISNSTEVINLTQIIKPTVNNTGDGVALATSILNIVGSKFDDLWTLGVGLHLLSLFLCLCMTTYTARYLSINPLRSNDGDNNFVILSYTMCASYLFVILILMFFAIDDYSTNYGNIIVDAYSRGLIMYSLSFIIIWYRTVIFKPLLPNICYTFNCCNRRPNINGYQNLNTAKKQKCHKCCGNCCNIFCAQCCNQSLFYSIEPDVDRIGRLERYGVIINFFTKYGFYEDLEDIRKHKIWTSISLLIMFIFSTMLMNFSFAMYYNDKIYHDILVTMSVSSFTFCSILQLIIFVCNNKILNLLDDFDTTASSNVSRKSVFYLWTFSIVVWFIGSFILFMVYFPYQTWQIDPKYPTTTYMRNIFYLVQGGIAIIGLSGILVYVVIFLLKWCCIRWCCKRPKSIVSSITKRSRKQEFIL